MAISPNMGRPLFGAVAGARASVLEKLPCEVVYCGREVCGDLEQVEAREFLVTNGMGGYASLTAGCSLTRSYHGLLIAALRPPLDRTLLLSKLDETAVYLGRTYHLGMQRYKANSTSLPSPATVDVHYPTTYTQTTSAGDIVRPCGHLYLDSVRLEGTVPVFTYALADALLEKRVWMKQGANTVFVAYYLRRASDVVELSLSALVNHRDHHQRTSAISPAFDHSTIVKDRSTVCVSFGTQHEVRTTLSMRLERGRVKLASTWIPDLVLHRERCRGLPNTDAALHAATFSVDLVPGERATFVATSDSLAEVKDGETELARQHDHEVELLARYDDAQLLARERRRYIARTLYRSVPCVEQWPRSGGGSNGRRLSICGRAPESDMTQAIRQLVLAADQYIIARMGLHSIVAGYHWFTDWARDTMISLPGLTIITGRFDLARSIILMFARYASKGMLPNRFPDDGTPPTDSEYNNVDGTLWYFESIRAYYTASDDLSIIEDLYDTLEEIIDAHVKGTRFGIVQDDDGLLWAGANGFALTWMDAKVDNRVMTPRRGKAVEVQALWYNALVSMVFFSRELDRPERAEEYRRMADRTERAFRHQLWCPHNAYCYDVIDRDGKADDTLRPNQLVAAAINFSPLTPEQRMHVVRRCAEHLLTAHGVRTLPEHHPEYHGVYDGDIVGRDAAYHQGTAWAWLLGPFVMAHLSVHGDKRGAREFLRPILRSHLNHAGLGQISEIFDGRPPHRARGCIAQAWSVAEILRAWAATEDDG